jgi:DNA-directed RNA polymerase beta' subunit
LKSKDSVISRAAFETPTEILEQFAIKGQRDELKGMTESIIFGTVPKMGTGIVSLKNQVIQVSYQI